MPTAPPMTDEAVTTRTCLYEESSATSDEGEEPASPVNATSTCGASPSHTPTNVPTASSQNTKGSPHRRTRAICPRGSTSISSGPARISLHCAANPNQGARQQQRHRGLSQSGRLVNGHLLPPSQRLARTTTAITCYTAARDRSIRRRGTIRARSPYITRSRPDHVLFVLDAQDAFQTVRRTVALERMSKIAGLEAQTGYWHARRNVRPFLSFVGPLGDRLFGDENTRGDSEEGVMQGAPDSPAVYCVDTHDELVSLDTAVAAEGGVARA